jgi:hypothetical protein
MSSDFYAGALSDIGLSTDPLTQNRYVLAAGNPVSFVEVDGHAPTTDDVKAGFCRVNCKAAAPIKPPGINGGSGTSDAHSGDGYGDSGNGRSHGSHEVREFRPMTHDNRAASNFQSEYGGKPYGCRTGAVSSELCGDSMADPHRCQDSGCEKQSLGQRLGSLGVGVLIGLAAPFLPEIAGVAGTVARPAATLAARGSLTAARGAATATRATASATAHAARAARWRARGLYGKMSDAYDNATVRILLRDPGLPGQMETAINAVTLGVLAPGAPEFSNFVGKHYPWVLEQSP